MASGGSEAESYGTTDALDSTAADTGADGETVVATAFHFPQPLAPLLDGENRGEPQGQA